MERRGFLALPGPSPPRRRARPREAAPGTDGRARRCCAEHCQPSSARVRRRVACAGPSSSSCTSLAAVVVARLRMLGFAIERVSALRGGQSVFGWLHGLVVGSPGPRISMTSSVVRLRGVGRSARRATLPRSALPSSRCRSHASRPRRSQLSAAADRSTSRRVVPERGAEKIIVVMPAYNAPGRSHRSCRRSRMTG